MPWKTIEMFLEDRLSRPHDYPILSLTGVLISLDELMGLVKFSIAVFFSRRGIERGVFVFSLIGRSTCAHT